jgi:hypothetical protein
MVIREILFWSVYDVGMFDRFGGGVARWPLFVNGFHLAADQW